ncbi:hypothetical protein EJB05_46255, partial [Eragrostis curvula]
MLVGVAVLPYDRRVASAVRRFPPGCGRPRNAAAQKPPRPLPPSTTKLPLPNPSARAATGAAAPPPRRTIPAAAASGTVETDRGAGNEGEATPAVTVRRVAAVRRYPPGCGRGVAVAKLPALVGEGEAGASESSVLVGVGEAVASKPLAEVCIEAKGKACDREAALCECAIGDSEFNFDGGMENGIGGGDAGAQEEGSGKHWVATALMEEPLIPWAQHGRRSQRPKA